MKYIEDTKIKGSTWGVVDLPDHEGHFYTGFVGYSWKLSFDPKESMQNGRNVVLEGTFVIDDMSRGRSAANFHGYFAGHPDVKYDLAMSSVFDVFQNLRTGKMTSSEEGIFGRWTFAKMGQDIFLIPAK